MATASSCRIMCRAATCVYCRRGNETMCEVFKENLMEPGGFADTILIRERATELAARKLPDIAVRRGGRVHGAGRLRASRHPPLRDWRTEGAALVLGAGSMGLLHLLVLQAVLPEGRGGDGRSRRRSLEAREEARRGAGGEARRGCRESGRVR